MPGLHTSYAHALPRAPSKLPQRGGAGDLRSTGSGPKGIGGPGTYTRSTDKHRFPRIKLWLGDTRGRAERGVETSTEPQYPPHHLSTRPCTSTQTRFGGLLCTPSGKKMTSVHPMHTGTTQDE